MKMKLWALLGFALLLSTFPFAQTSATIMAVRNSANPTAKTEANSANPTTKTEANSATPATKTEANSATPAIKTEANSATPALPTEITPSITIVPDQLCAGKKNFEPCIDAENDCGPNSDCSCKNEKPFCRCQNDAEKWYIGQNCQQEWTVVTFALVASLPGIALATIVGVAVHCVHHSRKKRKPIRVESEKESSPADEYSNIVFASDLKKPQLANGKPAHDSIPMASQPYSAYRGEVYKNPYLSAQPSKNPYSSQDRYDAYRNPRDPPGIHNGIGGGTPLYSNPDYTSSRQPFPRAQVGRQY